MVWTVVLATHWSIIHGSSPGFETWFSTLSTSASPGPLLRSLDMHTCASQQLSACGAGYGSLLPSHYLAFYHYARICTNLTLVIFPHQGAKEQLRARATALRRRARRQTLFGSVQFLFAILPYYTMPYACLYHKPSLPLQLIPACAAPS